MFREGLNENFSFHYNGQRYRFDIPDLNSMKYLYFLKFRQGLDKTVSAVTAN